MHRVITIFYAISRQKSLFPSRKSLAIQSASTRRLFLIHSSTEAASIFYAIQEPTQKALFAYSVGFSSMYVHTIPNHVGSTGSRKQAARSEHTTILMATSKRNPTDGLSAAWWQFLNSFSLRTSIKMAWMWSMDKYVHYQTTIELLVLIGRFFPSTVGKKSLQVIDVITNIVKENPAENSFIKKWIRTISQYVKAGAELIGSKKEHYQNRLTVIARSTTITASTRKQVLYYRFLGFRVHGWNS